MASIRLGIARVADMASIQNVLWWESRAGMVIKNTGCLLSMYYNFKVKSAVL